MVIIMYGCEEDDKNILSDLEDLPTPVLTSVTEVAGLGGTDATIEGTGFSTTPANNLITFGPSDNFGYQSVRANAATATSLTYTRPLISAIDAIVSTEVRVSRIDDKNPERSNGLNVDFLPLISVYAEGFVRPRAIAFDSDGVCYFVEFNHGNEVVIKKKTATGYEDHAVFPSATYLRGEMEFDSEGTLWSGQIWDNLHYIPAGGGDPIDTGLGRSRGVSVDANDNVYFTFFDIQRLAPDGTVTTLLEGDDMLNSTVADGYLYWMIRGGALYKAPITNDGIGAIELIVEPEGDYWSNSIVVDTDGNVYGTGGAEHGSPNASNIYKIAPDGTESIVYSLDAESPWGLEFHGEYLYVTIQNDGRILQLYMAGAVGAGL